MSRDLSHFIDLESLPLRSPGSDQYQALVAAARQALATDGCYVLPGAIRDEALREMQAEAQVYRRLRSLHAQQSERLLL